MTVIVGSCKAGWCDWQHKIEFRLVCLLQLYVLNSSRVFHTSSNLTSSYQRRMTSDLRRNYGLHEGDLLAYISGLHSQLEHEFHFHIASRPIYRHWFVTFVPHKMKQSVKKSIYCPHHWSQSPSERSKAMQRAHWSDLQHDCCGKR